MILSNYDADASGELNQAELQTALEGLRQLIVQQTQAARAAASVQRNSLGVQTSAPNPISAGISPRPPRGRPIP
ncbi:hypothetical protein [Stieleria mannarensis]|uniref:hypothetical protein n=1 Tax=Stieleria mannarensis TaxID=2755585 RepID=UPI001604983E|nr:hypothetical protein [Rhodopirellula sp. JC639]